MACTLWKIHIKSRFKTHLPRDLKKETKILYKLYVIRQYDIIIVRVDVLRTIHEGKTVDG